MSSLTFPHSMRARIAYNPGSMQVQRHTCGVFCNSIGQAWLAATLAGCTKAPAQDLFGSFFPAWMLCAVAGIGGAILLRVVLGLAGVMPFVPAPALTFIAIAVAVTLLVWLLWFGN